MAKQPDKRQQESHVRTRAFAGMPSTVSEDGRSFDVVIFTEAPVRTWITDPRNPNQGIEVDEVLLASGLDLSQSPRMPLVNNHNSYGDIRTTVLGRIADIRPDGQKVVGRATLSNLHKDLAQDIAEGFLGNISATYFADEYELTEREGDVPLAIAHRTILLDGSMVPVGADPNASVRGNGSRAFPAPKLRNQNQPQETPKMDELETAIVAAEDAVAALDAALDAAGDKASDELIERANKVRGKREELTDEEKQKLADEEAARAKRFDEDDLTADEKKKDDEEIRGLRSTAATWGLTKLVDDLKGLGARSKEIRTALKTAVAARGVAPAASTDGLKPAPLQTTAVPELNARSIYDKLNGRTK